MQTHIIMESTKSNITQYDPVEIIEDEDVNAGKVNRYHAMFTNIINKNNATAKSTRPKKLVKKEETHDEHDEEDHEELVKSSGSHQTRQISNAPLKKYDNEDPLILEIGVDEAGRGPLFGRVYSGAVILPKDDTFDHSLMKDSKKFHSKKKITEVAEYIKTHAIAWGVGYCTEQTIDDINILQATQQSMHKAIRAALKGLDTGSFNLLVDGNYFKPYIHNTDPNPLPYTTVEGGDNTYTCIAAASILAKVARDDYIDELCRENPELEAHYGIASNKGYGAKRHIDGIKEHGITIWHRRSFGICKQY
jgi:ribonuclease HII